MSDWTKILALTAFFSGAWLAFGEPWWAISIWLMVMAIETELRARKQTHEQ